MILNNAPQNEAVLSNVGEIGEFRIRNSAKAFNILSSGLYANKVKAIIRELSCNAVDSHVAAGKADVPFDVHLPTALEPHFSIRDYGTGLSHDQVTNIYTTYFESTKTGSNDFIGALGLGSKSPFSYTDNFTVTAIKDGRKGIYSAFINGEGVPSIALMMEEQTDEPSGVEIKFSVNDRFDYDKFKREAASVYYWFQQKPNITNMTITIENPSYETADLIPGVHVRKAAGASYAVMGNIAYPIEIPAADKTLEEDLRNMLPCGLVMHFGIGELDFQASREGLSYIPQTVHAIRSKLCAVRDVLAQKVAVEADAIENLWERAYFLNNKYHHPLWKPSVIDYSAATKLGTVNPHSNGWYGFIKTFKLFEEDLATKFNVSLRGVACRTRSSTIKPSHEYSRSDDGVSIRKPYYDFSPAANTYFIINDAKSGAGERVKYHFKEKDVTADVYILEKADKTKEIDIKGFFDEIFNPPKKQIMNASDLLVKPRQTTTMRDVSILQVTETRRRGDTVVIWEDAGKLSDFDSTKTHYYLPLSGFVVQSDYIADGKEYYKLLKSCGVPELMSLKVLGVRKADLATVKSLPNWVNAEEYLMTVIKKPDQNVLNSIARSQLPMFDFVCDRYDSYKIKFNEECITDENSLFKKYVEFLRNTKKVEFSEGSFSRLYTTFGKEINFDFNLAVKNIVDQFADLHTRYPLLKFVSAGYSGDNPRAAVIDYVNSIDQVKV